MPVSRAGPLRRVPAGAACLLLAACLTVLGPMISASSQEASSETAVFSQSRPFQGLVRRDTAERMARVAAENDALRQAMRILAKEPDLHYADSPQGSSSLPPLEGLALKLFSTTLAGSGVRGFPPDMQAVMEVVLVPPPNLRQALLQVLGTPCGLDMYAMILWKRMALIPQCDTLAARLLPLNPHTEGGEDGLALRHRIQHLDALDILLDLLPTYDTVWPDPEKAYLALTKANSLAPDDPAISTALAEALMQLDRPAEAQSLASRAADLAPFYARAHDILGIAYLRQRLPVLAARSFTRAIELEPRDIRFLLHRGSAYLLLEEEESMCTDLRAACALGDCETYQWARTTDKCLGERKNGP